jgi:hypothetical protein
MVVGEVPNHQLAKSIRVDGVIKILHLLRCGNFYIITTHSSTPK